MKALITGARGQVGRALLAAVPSGVSAMGTTHAELDITDREAVRRCIDSARPDVIVNVAAYTAVDRAESDRNAAERTNAGGPRHLAEAAAALDARMIQVSTDFVFDGSRSVPYRPDDAASPISVYGLTKLAGEAATLELLGANGVILRTSWVYDAQGQNFVRTMLRLMRERGSVRVVADQVGTPTAAHSVAQAIWAIVHRADVSGRHHWTDSGVASWYDFAVAIAEEAEALALLPGGIEVIPIATAEYPSAARRPAYSVLEKRGTSAALGLAAPHWRQNLRVVLRQVQRA